MRHALLEKVLTIETSGPSGWDKTGIHGVALKAIFGGATGTSAAGASSFPAPTSFYGNVS